MKKHEIARLLPEVFQECLTDPSGAAGGGGASSSPLDVLVSLAEAHTEPIEKAHRKIAACFDPETCNETFLPFLGAWLDVERFVNLIAASAVQSAGERSAGEKGTGDSDFASASDVRVRRLIGRAALLARTAGTAEGITSLLETMTGIDGFRVRDKRTDAGEIIPFEMTIVCPDGAKRYRRLIEEVVQRRKPAYLVCEVVYEPRS